MRFFRAGVLLSLLALWLNAAEQKSFMSLTEELAAAAECHARGGLPNFFAKLRAGGEVRIAYLGGSITAQEGWRPKTLNWFQEQFPLAKVSQINAAIGGTGSDLGVFRLKQDVLDQRPDLLFDRTRQRSSASGARKSMIQSGSTARRGMRVRC